MWHDDLLAEKVHAYADIHYETEADIAQYYQQSYPGKEGRSLAWKKHLVAGILEMRGITPENTDKKEYAKQKKSLDKRFEKRLTTTKSKPKPTTVAEYKQFGKTLPPMDYKLPFAVNVAGLIKISGNCVPCAFTVHIGQPGTSVSRLGANTSGAYSLQGANAEAFVRNPNMWDLIVAYFEGDPDNPVEGWCAPPSITITA